MSDPLKCLLVEDSEDDAQLMLHQLRAGGYDVHSECVESAEGVTAALDRQAWDIVIADYRMPGFCGIEALTLARARDPDLPFILVSGQMGEEFAVEAMRAGANDYLTKEQLHRLAPAVERGLREAATRRAQRLADAALRSATAALQASEAQLTFVTDHVPVMIAHLDDQRRYKFVNRQYAQRFGLEPADLLGRHTRELLGESIYAQAEPHIGLALSGRKVEYELDTPCVSGSQRTLHAVYAPEFDAVGQVVGFVAALVDISARKRAENALRSSNQNLQATLDASPDLFFEMGLDGRYYSAHSPTTDLLVASPEQIVGKLTTEVLPADAAQTVLAVLQEAHEQQTSTGKQIQLLLPGGLTWFELSAARKAMPAGEPPRFVLLSRDITARVQNDAADGFLAQAGIDPDSEPFFQALARFLATSLQMDYICIDRLENDQLTATTLAVWHDGGFEDNLQYSLADTPCGQVPGQKICLFPARVSMLFPRDAALQELRAESYVGVPLQSHDNITIGLIAAIGRRPLTNRTLAETLLTRVAPRAAAELERLLAEEALRSSNAILSKFNALAVGRELRMVELKREINELCAQLGKPPRHQVAVAAGSDPG